MAIGKQEILSWFSRRVKWGTDRVSNSCRSTAADQGGLAKIHSQEKWILHCPTHDMIGLLPNF